MADSDYYNDLYKQYKKKAGEYKDNIRELTKIKNKLTENFYDEQNNVNKKLSNLEEDLLKSVRHDSAFSSIAAKSVSFKEKSTASDYNLRCVVTALEDEIAALNNKKDTAERNKKDSYEQYQTRKQEERQEFLNSLMGNF